MFVLWIYVVLLACRASHLHSEAFSLQRYLADFMSLYVGSLFAYSMCLTFRDDVLLMQTFNELIVSRNKFTILNVICCH